MADEAGATVRVLLAASEVVGFAKTGGLADVAGSLPPALARLGVQVAVMMPLYRSVRVGPVPIQPTPHLLAVPVGRRVIPSPLWQSRIPDSDVPIYFIEQPDFFERDDPAHGRGLYQYAVAGGIKHDYYDNGERFTFFCRAVLEAVRVLDMRPDILHANDWQTGLVPVYLAEPYRRRYGYEQLRSVFTIHNIAYQGYFPGEMLPLTGLEPRLFNYKQLECYGQLNFLKAGVVFADRITTVSPSYAEEIQTPEYGYGMQGVLQERRHLLRGIVNGVDYRAWNPANDPHIPFNYTPETVREGKLACKRALQARCALKVDPTVPLLGMVARLVEQKGVDLVAAGAEDLLRRGVQLVILGDGELHYHNWLRDIAARYPSQFSLNLTFDERLAHQIEAGIDIFLMPSRYEPSGLNQLYSLKYGAVPVVRATGGLADTIVDCTEGTIAAGTATGFWFHAYSPQALIAAVDRALDLYRNDPATWVWLQQNGMRQDWSWDRSARQYLEVYRDLLAQRDAGRPILPALPRNRN